VSYRINNHSNMRIFDSSVHGINVERNENHGSGKHTVIAISRFRLRKEIRASIDHMLRRQEYLLRTSCLFRLYILIYSSPTLHEITLTCAAVTHGTTRVLIKYAPLATLSSSRNRRLSRKRVSKCKRFLRNIFLSKAESSSTRLRLTLP